MSELTGLTRCLSIISMISRTLCRLRKGHREMPTERATFLNTDMPMCSAVAAVCVAAHEASIIRCRYQCMGGQRCAAN